MVRIESAESADHLLGQSPAAGALIPPGSPVNLTVASGSNVVPQVAGMTVASALAHLQSAGFPAAPDRLAVPGTAAVSGTQPAAGTVLRVGVALTLVVAESTPRPTKTPGSG